MRYAILEGDSTSQDGVVFDSGGPGIAVFGDHWPAAFDESIRPSIPEPPVLLIEEPWVTSTMPSGCSTALSSWFAQAHSGSVITTSLTPCGLGEGSWGWTPDLYREAVTAVEFATGVRVDAMVGASFGAFRSQYLGSRLAWVALVNPAPASSDGASYIRERRSATLSLLRARCGCTSGQLEERLASLAQEVERGAATRSVPTTAADVGAAALALAYVASDEAFDQFWSGDIATIGRLADSTWGRYGTDKIAPSYLAYLDEVCAAYAPWPAQKPSSDIVMGVLEAIHAPCADVSSAHVEDLPLDVRTCVASRARDPIAPPNFVDSWRADQLFVEDGDEHQDVRSASRCISALRDSEHP